MSIHKLNKRKMVKNTKSRLSTYAKVTDYIKNVLKSKSF